MRTVVLVFDGITALDAIGPYEVLGSVPGWEVQFAGKERGEVRTDSGALGISADHALGEVGEPEILLVPGGIGSRALMEDEEVLEWLRQPLREFGADPVGGRFVEDGKVITAAGVSAGIDMALHLVAQEAGPEVAQAVQLGIEYDPQPPFDAGHPSKAPEPIVEIVTAVSEAEGSSLNLS